MLSKLSLDNI